MPLIERHPPIVESALPAASPAAPLTCRLQSEDETRALAQALARALLLPGGPGAVFITLDGELGAGKTTLVRHLLHALGVTGRVKSPTYAVVEPYEVGSLAIWHFDFYRFEDPQEWEDAGFRDIFASPGLKLAEWPDKAGDLLPQADVALHLQVLGDVSRQLTLQGVTPAGRLLLQGLVL
ncbi:MAG: tRNA (adenosine(37)-N6)-threonylcarbamoyltransferase complex ATPase subunit type 1 TsaE [Burkholderiaceae bacterium]